MRDEVLLEAFAERGDAAAFRQLVERYTPVVYAAARRQIRDEHMAEDVTQAVFVLLARKAASIRGGGGALPSWLITATRLCALATLREEVRRKAREARVAAAGPTSTASHPAGSEQPMLIDAQAVERAIDEALCHLPEKDRAAVVLRYLQGKSQREVADAMGVSEGAAAQRLSRAMAKLRKFFSSRGIMLATVAATELALQHAGAKASTIPAANLAVRAADLALSPAGNGVPYAIANSVLTSLRRKAAATLAAASLGLLLMLAFVGVSAAHLTRGVATGGAATANAASPTPSTASPVVKSRIRVGVYISAATAIPRPPSDDAWHKMFKIADDLKDEADMDVIPLVEAGSLEEPHEKRLLGVYFPGKTPINVMDTAALRKLDAIVACNVHEPPQQALDSIDAAVHDGTGLYTWRCLGGHGTQGRTPVAVRLRGLATIAPEGKFGVSTRRHEMVVVNAHPILGSLTSTSLKTPMRRSVAGVWGTLPPGAVPLIRLKDVQELAKRDPGAGGGGKTGGTPAPTARYIITPEETAGDAIWLSQLGKGRIVNANFYFQIWPEIQEATKNRFTALVVKWLAGRPVE